MLERGPISIKSHSRISGVSMCVYISTEAPSNLSHRFSQGVPAHTLSQYLNDTQQKGCIPTKYRVISRCPSSWNLSTTHHRQKAKDRARIGPALYRPIRTHLHSNISHNRTNEKPTYAT